jgi:plastocyanin
VVGAIATLTVVPLVACGPPRPATASQPVAGAVKPTDAVGAKPAASIGTVARPTADGPRIEIRNFAFASTALAIPVGATVTWTNDDSEPHTVYTTDLAIASKALDTNEQFAFTFTVPGTYSYHCSLHPFMTATVVVR